jgi:glycosyltransferase involved in cell wall biosynthesis
MATMPVPQPDDGPAPALRILTDGQYLAPVGGVELCTVQDSVALVRRGHRVDVVYGTDGALRSTYEDAGITLHGPHRFSFGPRTAVRDLLRMSGPARWARDRAHDVVWLNRIEHVIWGQVVSRTARASLVCHLHGLPAHNRLAQVSRGVAHFIAVSDFVRDVYVERGIAPERITRIHNALPPGAYPYGGDLERARARRQLGLPDDVPVVLCYGHMSVEKGVLVLLAAWRRVREVVPDALLVLVDSMSAQPVADVRAELAGLEPASYRTFPATSDVVPFLQASDVIAFPTQLPESFGRVVIEGLASGRPVVASRIGAVPEVLSGDLARFLISPRSPAELAERLVFVLDWRRTEPRLGRACSTHVERRFPFDGHVRALEDVLHRYRARRPKRHLLQVARG